MAHTISRVNPADVKEEILDLFWFHRHWPGERDGYGSLWDWRYTCLGDGDPIAWVARDAGSGRIIGHLALFPRRFMCGNRELTGAVSGDFLVDEGRRSVALALDLAKCPGSLAATRELDFVLAIAPPHLHQLHLRIGYRELGRFVDYLDLRTTTHALRRRWPLAVPISPLMDALLRIRRQVRRRSLDVPGLRRRFRVEALEVADLHRLERDHWIRPPHQPGGNDRIEYIRRRYCTQPDAHRTVLAVFDAETGRADAYAVVGLSTDRATVLDIQTNADRLQVGATLALLADQVGGEGRSLVVSCVEGSAVSDALRRLGFWLRGAPASRFHAAMYRHRAQPADPCFATPSAWPIFIGYADF